MAPAVRKPVAPAAAPLRVKVSTGSFSASSTIVKFRSAVTVAAALALCANTNSPPKPSSLMVRPVAAASVNSAASRPASVNGTVTSALRTPPLMPMRNRAAPPFSATVCAAGSAGCTTLMTAVMGSSSVMAVAWAAPTAMPPWAVGSAAATCSVKFSVASLMLSPTMLMAKDSACAVISRSVKVKLPVTAAKSASTVPAPLSDGAWLMVQWMTMGAVNGAPVRRME